MKPTGKPATIAQLAEAALDNLWDETRELKHYLRTAEKYRKQARQHVVEGDLENAFVMFAKAATLVLEKIPTHRDFTTLLNPAQRNNLTLNGQEMLEKMGEIKPILIDRLAKWNAEHATDEIGTRGVTVRWADGTGDPPRQGIPAAEGQRMIQEELEKWRELRAARALEDEKDRRLAAEAAERKKAAAVAAAQRAAGIAADDELARQQRQQEEMRQREEEILRRRELKRQEQEGIAKRQQEADETARNVRQTIAANNPGVTVTSAPSVTYSTSASSPTTAGPSSSFYPPPSQTVGGPRAPTDGRPRPPSFQSIHEPPKLPLESPARFEDDSTDSEPNPTRAPPARSPSYPPPITTTSPPPAEGTRIHYPQLMSQHQKRQGYQPSPNSMFIAAEDASRLHHASYPTYLLSRSHHSAPPPVSMPHPSPAPHAPPSSHPPVQYPSYPGPSRPAPPLPPAVQPPPLMHVRSNSERAPRTRDGLRQISLPRDCLPRFLTIAKANTNLNLETCGLLLGRDRGAKFVVTTLLIPKQHATSDTCTMDEEELVLQFTEERGLITLGWIHTHPSQSCFMSSVDLHTHSGFQRMLPESFAVVCAPKSNPNFGIFRLTDPPGLKTVLECTAKEAFHPHPDLPIYTDADKGHVQMKDMQLEIVDLR
ncbi:putative prokaryotic homologs of the JAB domain containing protein [Lyophyllum shimeji]|uniref:Prokaryotic homologs of the JAB domain containing protein n=1 Tax=Lyophyllum shimeji TaxID=47721 RepID=A0A9P3PNA0_LYOSH|nr:putative prokaryotic homologs of the JAB domain containing protein [Lyophyllum shimeji]